MRSFWPALWCVLLAVVLAVELVALLRPSVGDTLSEQVWALRQTTWRFVLTPLWLWLGYHLLFEPLTWSAVDVPMRQARWLDDIVVVALGVLLGVAVRRKAPRDET